MSILHRATGLFVLSDWWSICVRRNVSSIFLSALYSTCVAAPGRIRSRHLSIGLAEPPSRLKEEEGCLRQPSIPLAAGE